MRAERVSYGVDFWREADGLRNREFEQSCKRATATFGSGPMAVWCALTERLQSIQRGIGRPKRQRSLDATEDDEGALGLALTGVV